MQITFGMYLDGAEWSQQTASLGEIKLGPQLLTSWLESRLGLDGVHPAEPERINEYMQKIRHVNPDWSKASFELDSWSTAKQLLAWRDELFENGWDGKSGSSERLKTLAALEADSGALSPGMPDRIRTILGELQKYQFSDTLILQDSSELLPYLWKQVTTKLDECGMNIVETEQSECCTPAKIQLNGADEFVLARECARFLAAGENNRTAIICEGDSSVLDGAFQRNGIGRLNAAEKSRWRESLQILPLWLDTLWKPFNPQRFLELLLLPCSPIPKIISRELVKALQAEPGYGGEAWNQAWNEVKQHCNGNGKTDLPDTIAEVQDMLEKRCFKAEKSVCANEVISHCDFLSRRIVVQIEKHPELALTAAHAKTLKKIVAGRGMIKRMELARILDSIISTGTTGDQDGQERTDFAVFSNPGMIDRKFETILWWNFTDNGTASAANWTTDEITVMPGYNRAATRKLENLSWHNALNHAEKIIFFIPQKVRGEEVFPHPLLDELKIEKENIFTPEKLTDAAGHWSLAGRTAELEKQELFEPKSQANIGQNTIRPASLSATALKQIISCPRQWYLERYLGLKMPPAMSVPTGPLMLGTLAHKVVEEIYKGKETLTPEEAAEEAAEKFEELVPAMAAELLLDGRGVERQRIQKVLIDAVRALTEKINELGLRIKGNETELQGELNGIPMNGRTDIYLEDAAGGKFVIDMKWSASPHYEKDLQENKALQLAAYSWLLDSKDLNVQCAYFLFPLKKFIYNPDQKWHDLWNKAEAALEQRLKEIHAGKLARGIAVAQNLPDSTPELQLTAECTYCNYKTLCAMMEE